MEQSFLKEYFNDILYFFQIRHTLNYHNNEEINADYKEVYNKKFNILWGYYEILRKKNDTIISQFYTKKIDNDELKKFRSNVYNFDFIEITKGEEIGDDFISAIEESLQSNPQDFNRKFNVPKSFQCLDYFNIDIERNKTENEELFRSNSKCQPEIGSEKSDIKLYNFLTDFYKNTNIQRELDKHPFYVVLNEEVYFFLLLHKISCKDEEHSKEEVINFLKKVHNTPSRYGLRQLLKYTTSLIFSDTILSTEIICRSYREPWMTYFGFENEDKKEKKYRKFLNETYVSNLGKIADLIHPFCNYFIKKSREELSMYFNTSSYNDTEFLNLLTRFHIKPYEVLFDQSTILPDFFVFPIFHNYKNTGVNQLKTKNLPLDLEGGHYINLNRPVLFSCYVKPIFEIERENGNIVFDESPETIRGFHLTKVIAKELAAPLIQSEFFGPQILNRIRPQAIKSSLAAVMSRNQSHNIGSHVLNKMSSSQVVKDFFELYENPSLCFLQDFNEGEDRLIPKENLNDKQEIKERLNNERINEDYYLATFENLGGIYKPVYILTQKPNEDAFNPAELSRVFNNYLKQRMDFVADVATSDQFDLTNNKLLISDMFRSFERNLLLLHNISGKGAEFPFTFKFEYYARGSVTPQKDFDPIVSIPNDVLGDQAFYTLLENIIRNTAKHAPKKQGHITFTFKIEDKFDDFFKVSVYDDIKYVLTEDEKLSCNNDISAMDKKKRNKLLRLIAQRNNNIAQNILDPETNEIRAQGWGTIEMKIACCYLNRVPSTSIDDIEYAPLGLHLSKTIDTENFDFEKYDAFFKDEKEYYRDRNLGWIENPSEFCRTREGQNYLPLLQATDGSKEFTSGFGYSFLLKKPMEVLILDSEGILNSFLGETLENIELNVRNLESKTRKILHQLGIHIVDKIDENIIYVHNYFLVIGDDNLNRYTKMLNLPQQIYSVTINEKGALSNYNHLDYFTQEVVSKSKLDICEYFKYCMENGEATNLTRIFDELYFNSIKQFVSPSSIGNFDTLGTAHLHHLNFNSIVNRLNIKEPIMGSYQHHGLEKTTFLKEIGDAGFVELYGSSSRIGFYLMSLSNKIDKVVNSNTAVLNNIRYAAYHFLVKGCNTNIAIVDERVQKVLKDEAFVAENETGQEGDYCYNYEDVFKGIKINVPSEDEINLNQTGLNTKIEGMLQWIETNTKKCHYLIIHFGIIESLRYGTKGILEVKDEIKILCNENNCKLVITSGRGFTKDVASLNEYFLSYSSLSNLVLDKNNRSKAHLVSVLNALRKLN